ncbi:MAG TPA: holo-ACP synthase [Lentisphaeria bacterium]|nr:MAG: holo-[acyl-carrier-protein] synthase [Lentisphaerae bacterium GWF2_49_21]HBC85375.1 holo-ACP synthase [Lentisphaeria bacterium]
MILGMGTDIVEISRIRKILKKNSYEFLSKVFTRKELRESQAKKNSAEYLAGRWAVKEAVSKALGCGIGSDCSWKDINTANDAKGAPKTSLSGTALKTSRKKHAGKIHVSISHEKDFAIATVILEK